MPDGSSGLSLSEIGVSSVKKTAQVIKKYGGTAVGQVKQQIGGTFVPGQSGQLPSAGMPNESNSANRGGLDLGSFFNEKGNSTQNTNSSQGQQIIDPSFSTQIQEQKAKDQKQMEILRKRLHDAYFEEFIRKAEGKDKTKEEEERKKQELKLQEEEEKKRKEEQEMQPVELSQSTQKGMPGQKKKSGFSLMKLLKPKMGSHEGTSNKG